MILRLLVVSFWLVSLSSYADERTTPESYTFIGSEYTNAGLLNGINYNTWLYWLFSGFTEDKPSRAIGQIEERANRSEVDARELLVGLSEILKDDEPAGGHIVDLFNSLLVKSQISSMIPVTIMNQVLSTRDLTPLDSLSNLLGSGSDKIDQALVSFLALKISIKGIDLNRADDFNYAKRLVALNIDQISNWDVDNLLNEITATIIETNNSEHIISIEQLLHDSMRMRHYFYSGTSTTEAAQNIFDLRSLLLSNLDVATSKEISLTNIRTYRLSSNSNQNYFNFKKLEPYLAVLEEIGDEDALNAIAEQIRLMVQAVERMNVEISTTLTKIARSTGYTPRVNTNRVRSGYTGGGGGGNTSSADVVEFFRQVDLRNNTRDEIAEMIEASNQICSTAAEKEDTVVMASCANELISKFMRMRDSTTDRNLKAALNNSINFILNKTHDHFDESYFDTSCEKVDLERALTQTQEDFRKIEEVEVRIVNRRFSTAYGIEYRGINKFKFVNCLDPKYSVLISRNNMTQELNGRDTFRLGGGVNYKNFISNWTNNTYIGFETNFNRQSLRNLFFIDATTVGVCSSIYAHELTSSSNYSETSYQLGPRIVSIVNYIVDRHNKYGEVMSIFNREGSNIEMNDSEKRFDDFFENELRSQALTDVNFVRQGDYKSLASLTDIEQKICTAHNKIDNINCLDNRESVNCGNDSAVYSPIFTYKNNEVR